jgi:hypothetical protein
MQINQSNLASLTEQFARLSNLTAKNSNSSRVAGSLEELQNQKDTVSLSANPSGVLVAQIAEENSAAAFSAMPGVMQTDLSQVKW